MVQLGVISDGLCESAGEPQKGLGTWPVSAMKVQQAQHQPRDLASRWCRSNGHYSEEQISSPSPMGRTLISCKCTAFQSWLCKNVTQGGQDGPTAELREGHCTVERRCCPVPVSASTPPVTPDFPLCQVWNGGPQPRLSRSRSWWWVSHLETHHS